MGSASKYKAPNTYRVYVQFIDAIDAVINKCKCYSSILSNEEEEIDEQLNDDVTPQQIHDNHNLDLKYEQRIRRGNKMYESYDDDKLPPPVWDKKVYQYHFNEHGYKREKCDIFRSNKSLLFLVFYDNYIATDISSFIKFIDVANCLAAGKLFAKIYYIHYFRKHDENDKGIGRYFIYNPFNNYIIGHRTEVNIIKPKTKEEIIKEQRNERKNN